MLVTEWLPVVLMADYIRVAHRDPVRVQNWLAENNVNPRRVAVRLVHTFQRQLFEDNLFHGDMHPGNIGLLRNNRVALIDFGTTNFTETEYLRRVTVFMQMLASEGFAKAADMCLMICASLPVIDIEEVHGRLVRVIRSWSARTLVKELPYHDKSLDNITLELMRVLLGFRCTMEWAWLRIHRGSSTLDASLIELHPGINYRKVTEQFFRKADRRRATAVVTATGARRAFGAVANSLDLHSRVRDYAFFQGEAIRRQAQVFRVASHRFANSIAALLSLAQLGVFVQAVLAIALAFVPPGPMAVGLPLGTMFASLPRLDWPILVIILTIDARVWYALSRLRHELRQPRGSDHRQMTATA